MQHDINVNIRQESQFTFGSLFILFVIVAIILSVWQWVLAGVGLIVAAVIAWRIGLYLAEQSQVRKAGKLALARRADLQHNLTLQGDPRGTYGTGHGT